MCCVLRACGSKLSHSDIISRSESDDDYPLVRRDETVPFCTSDRGPHQAHVNAIVVWIRNAGNETHVPAGETVVLRSDLS